MSFESEAKTKFSLLSLINFQNNKLPFRKLSKQRGKFSGVFPLHRLKVSRGKFWSGTEAASWKNCHFNYIRRPAISTRKTARKHLKIYSGKHILTHFMHVFATAMTGEHFGGQQPRQLRIEGYFATIQTENCIIRNPFEPDPWLLPHTNNLWAYEKFKRVFNVKGKWIALCGYVWEYESQTHSEALKKQWWNLYPDLRLINFFSMQNLISQAPFKTVYVLLCCLYWSKGRTECI